MMVHAGVAVAGSREDLAACLTPAAADVLARVSARLAFFTRHDSDYSLRPLQRYTHLEHARQERLHGSVPLNELRAAFLLHCLSDLNVMDACCSWGDPGWILLLDLIPLTPPSHVAMVACLIGIHAYQHGDGTMAIIAAQHALTTDPGYSFAELIIELTQSAIAPTDAGRELREAADDAVTYLQQNDARRSPQ